MPRFPPSITAPRLLIRSTRLADAQQQKEAIDTSLDHLRPWMPWAHHEPSTIDVLAERLQRFEIEFHDDISWNYGIFSQDSNTLLGRAGLHTSKEPNDIELGYWLRASATGQGFATECAAALTRAAFTSLQTNRVLVTCDPRNIRSSKIPERLGYQLIGRFPTAGPFHGRTEDMIWAMTRAAFSLVD
jgi:RimJ/RimL family protein N-acetyltransferase